MKKLSAIVLVLAFLTGCGEGEPQNSAEAAERINKSGSGLVRISEKGERRIVAKYLTPEYLATAEAESRGRKEISIDSLLKLYGRNMSFHFSVRDNRATTIDPARAGGDSSGITDVEATRGMFRMECGEEVWYPLCALPESRVGEAEQTWFVVFPVDPGTSLKNRKTFTITYAPLDDGGEMTHFTYNVEDLLHPEFIAINN